jgi:hypothetical protein
VAVSYGGAEREVVLGVDISATFQHQPDDLQVPTRSSHPQLIVPRPSIQQQADRP